VLVRVVAGWFLFCFRCRRRRSVRRGTMRSGFVVSIVVVAVASVAFMFRTGAALSEKKVRMSWWPVRIWFCASLILRRMVGSIVLFQASSSDVLARRRSSSGILKMRRSMASMSGLLGYGMVVAFRAV
jgi:hypothetical protein